VLQRLSHATPRDAPRIVDEELIVHIIFDDMLDEADALRATPAVTADDVRAAERAVAFCRKELAAAVADVQALDGLSGWISWLTGNHEADVERALQVVKDRKAKLGRAEAHLQRMQQAVRDVAEQDRAQQEQEVRRLMALELIAERVRAEGGPAAQQLEGLERQIAHHRAQSKDYAAVFAAGTALRGQLGRALRHLKTADWGASMDTYDAAGGGVFKMIEMRKVKAEVEDLPERLDRYQQVCSVIGLDIALGDGVQSVDAAMSATVRDAFFEGLLADWLTAARISEARGALEHLKGDIDRSIEPVIALRREADQRIDELERQREHLLEGQPPRAPHHTG